MAYFRRVAIRKRVNINIRIRDWRRSTRFWFTAQVVTMVTLLVLGVNFFSVGQLNERSRRVRRLTDRGYAPLEENLREAKSDIKTHIDSDSYNFGSDRLGSVPRGEYSVEKFEQPLEDFFHDDSNIARRNNRHVLPANSSDSIARVSGGSTHRMEMNVNKYPFAMKKFILFGMRPRWNKLCRSNKGYKDLVIFPRVISCPKTRWSVLLSYSESPADIAGHDVVLFTNVFEWLTPDMWEWAHGNRTEGQRWVMVTQESPFYVPGLQPPAKYGNATYDWIDSYSGTSDFHHPYGWFRYFRVPRRREVNVTNFMDRKTHLMTWMASHCETLQWDRKGFVKDLMGYLDLDTYGKCGGREIRWNKQRLYTAMLTKYKFYLSLENSCCDNYVTEKFWRSLKLGIVPVVVGAPLEDYLRVAPPNSFLHVDMFDSMEDMVSHIRELDSDDNKFIEYFRWRKMGQLTSRPSVDQFLLPLIDRTQCSLLQRYMRSSSTGRGHMIDYYHSDWHNSCTSCGKKTWMGKYMYDINHTRLNKDIWA